ncbi:oxidoreductase [Methylophilus luteus]|uniref:Oxidoreductase n=1 Tax=Methylophilus luteus TaxID=640108 RepID=A0ABW3F8B6_9PROT
MSTQSKVWFITGASRGFGALIAKDALARGDQVVATARNPQTVIAALGDHPNLLALQLDVTNEQAAIAAAKQTIQRFSRVDILVNNAGYGLLGAVEESGDQEVKDLFNTNVFGLLNVIRAVVPYMRQQASGHIINISSIGGYASYPGWGVYCATKFAVEALTESLDYELKALGVRATTVEPGFFRTDFLDSTSLVSTRLSLPEYAGTVGAMREFAASANHAQPGDPAKLSQAILKLADSDNPPLRLPLGSDTVDKLIEKNRFVEKELNDWRQLALSTDFA